MGKSWSLSRVIALKIESTDSAWYRRISLLQYKIASWYHNIWPAEYDCFVFDFGRYDATRTAARVSTSRAACYGVASVLPSRMLRAQGRGDTCSSKFSRYLVAAYPASVPDRHCIASA
eukprot:1004837-Rhodomonas_salina.4